MQRLHFKYEMEINYSIDAERCNFTIKCIPKDTLRQKISNLKIGITPPVVYRYGTDGFRNTQIYGCNEEPHKQFVFTLEGDAVTGLAEAEENADEDLSMIFSVPHGMNRAGEEIKKFYALYKPDSSMSTYMKAIKLMRALHGYMSYEPGTTDTYTTAEKAMIQRKGVCQDYTHIYIALLHLAGISARYVTGLIVGEGASHAWAEVLVDGKWYGMDPTNNKVVSDEHIKIGVGRDAGDCQINRGIMRGGGLHLQIIRVSVQKEQEE